MEKKVSGLATRLQSEGLLSAAQSRAAQEAARHCGQSLVRYLVSTRLVDSAVLARTVADVFGAARFDLSAFDPAAFKALKVDPGLALRHRALPLFRRDNILYVAVSDPTDTRELDAIRFQCGCPVATVVVDDHQLEKALGILSGSGTTHPAPETADTRQVQIEAEQALTTLAEAPMAVASGKGPDDASVVRFVSNLMLEAIRQRASDVHIEPYENACRIRFRIDGLLHEAGSPETGLAARIVSRLKILSRMDIAEKRLPQDGRIKIRISKARAIDFRVNTLPTQYGEKVVLRILDSVGRKTGHATFGPGPVEPGSGQPWLRA